MLDAKVFQVCILHLYTNIMHVANTYIDIIYFFSQVRNQFYNVYCLHVLKHMIDHVCSKGWNADSIRCQVHLLT